MKVYYPVRPSKCKRSGYYHVQYILGLLFRKNISVHILYIQYKHFSQINTPDEMAKSAAEKELDIIAFTEHDVLFDSELAEKLSRKYNILVLLGIEY